jgi:hypothetical protein
MLLARLGDYENALQEIDQACEIFSSKLPEGQPYLEAAQGLRERILRAIDAEHEIPAERG